MSLTREKLLQIEIERLEKVLAKAYEILNDTDVAGHGYNILVKFDMETEKDLNRFLDVK